MISREDTDRVKAAASFSFLPPIPSFLPNAFWQWQQWQRPHGWLVMWALEWRRPAFGSSGTHGRLLYIAEGPKWAAEYHTVHSNWRRIGCFALLKEAGEALLENLRAEDAEKRLTGAMPLDVS